MSGQNRPFKYGPNDRREYIVTDDEVAIRQQLDAFGNALLIGKAKVGTLTSEAKWQISYNTYTTNALTLRTWPQDPDGIASSDYIFVWDDRAGYTYS